jgi:hypothetical protein
MGNPTPTVNDSFSWGPNSNENVFGDMMSQRSMADSFVDLPPSSSQLFLNDLNIAPNLGLSQPSTSNSRSEVSSLSNASPSTRSLEDDILAFDPVIPKAGSSSKSPINRISPPSGDSKIKKRTLNTLAARRYRQKRVDQMSGLESALKETEVERDELKLKVARLEAEVEVLRRLTVSGNEKSEGEKS